MSLEPPPADLIAQFRPIYEWMVGLSRLIAEFDPSVRYTSWYRDEARNRAVGGDPQSQHLFGFALDIVADRQREIDDALTQIGLVTTPETDHLHVQLLPPGALARRGFFDRRIEV